MGTTWVAICSQATMRVFEKRGQQATLQALKTLENEAVNLKERDITRHRPGMVPEGGKTGVSRHVLGTGTDPHDLIVQGFARRIAQDLEDARRHRSFTELVIVAEPKFLGRIKRELPVDTRRLVSHWISKDLAKETIENISGAIGSVTSKVTQ